MFLINTIFKEKKVHSNLKARYESKIKSFRSQFDHVSYWVHSKTHHFVFLQMTQLSYLKSVWCFWGFLLRLIRTRAAFDPGLIILCYWGKTLLSPLADVCEFWGFPVWSMRPGVVPGPLWAQDSVPLLLSDGWRPVSHTHVPVALSWRLGGARHMARVLSAGSTSHTLCCHLHPLWSSLWTLSSVFSTQTVTVIHPDYPSLLRGLETQDSELDNHRIHHLSRIIILPCIMPRVLRIVVFICFVSFFFFWLFQMEGQIEFLIHHLAQSKFSSCLYFWNGNSMQLPHGGFVTVTRRLESPRTLI